MPSSVIQGKQEIKEWVQSKSDIKKIVDVGAGQATYPKLLGNKYDFTAIEIFADYVEMFDLHSYYKVIILGDVSLILRDTLGEPYPSGDCIIFGDVLEHMEKQTALRTLKLALKIYKHVIVSIPISDNAGEIRPGKTHYGNEYEAHISSWTWMEMCKLAKWDFVKLAGKNMVGIFCK